MQAKATRGFDAHANRPGDVTGTITSHMIATLALGSTPSHVQKTVQVQNSSIQMYTTTSEKEKPNLAAGPPWRGTAGQDVQNLPWYQPNDTAHDRRTSAPGVTGPTGGQFSSWLLDRSTGFPLT